MPHRFVVPAVLIALLCVTAGLTALDALVETSGNWLTSMALDFVDGLLMIGTAMIATFLVLRYTHLQNRTDELEGVVGRAAHEGKAWRAQSRRFIEGLSRSIDVQFESWSLTPAEADVAGLLLKGASLREIAVLRRTSEATIRQQAQGVYRKSGLGSRAELSAYFLEDLFTLGEATLANAHHPDERYDA